MAMHITRRKLLLGATSAAAAIVTTVGLLVPGNATGQAPGRPSTGTTVSVAQGRLHGAAATNYDAWLGIPYAAPPIGAFRWQAPRPAAHWSGTRDATHFGNRCVQGTGWDPGYETPKLTEDCLYLNVYAPDTVRRDLPVLVWIHGGGFTGGAGQDTDPRRYVQKNDSIVVTINYRLGILGFLNLPQLGTGAGNFGLLDQQAALRWLSRNIGAFGGDPHDITIAGQSAGGASVCDQLASPTAKGLFEKAVIVSGGCSMQSAASGQQAGARVVSALGCANAADVLRCLRDVSPSAILAAQASGVGSGPSLGGAAFPLDPADAVTTGRINRVPVINGQVHDENRLFVFGAYDYAGNPITPAMYTNLVNSTFGSSAPAVLARYPLADYPSPSIAWATIQSDQGSEARKVLDDNLSRWTRTYAYEFHVEDTPQFASIFRLQQTNAVAKAFPFGATHVDDLPYLWEYLGQTLPLTDDELALSDQITDYWNNFQRTGDPNGDGNPVWHHYTANSPTWFEEQACATDPANDDLPGACSVSGTGYLTDHQVAFWASM